MKKLFLVVAFGSLVGAAALAACSDDSSSHATPGPDCKLTPSACNEAGADTGAETGGDTGGGQDSAPPVDSGSDTGTTDGATDGGTDAATDGDAEITDASDSG